MNKRKSQTPAQVRACRQNFNLLRLSGCVAQLKDLTFVFKMSIHRDLYIKMKAALEALNIAEEAFRKEFNFKNKQTNI